MADPLNNSSSSSVSGKSFNKSLIKDVDDSYIPEGAWSHARNASKVSPNGNLSTLGNEPSNLHCVDIPYTCIGTIHLYGDVWAIMSTDDTNSAVGFFDDSECKYTPVLPALNCPVDSANCLNFKKDFLIIGISKQNFDCTWQIYWADGNNPDRTLNMNKPPFVETCVIINECNICTPTCELDCEDLRLARLTKSPCLSVKKGLNGGTLQNGSYYAVIAYTINDQRVTDYSVPSNVQSLFDHDNLSGSLQIDINDIDETHYDEFELVIVRTINQQTSAKRIGIYSVRTNQIFLDYINEALPTIPIEFIPFRSPLYEKSEGIYEIGVNAVRVSPSTKFDFNYQPLANQIGVKWVSVEYPSDYYRKGGNVTGYLRDEQYPFFIRWVYNTGDKSSSYHIPGRASNAFNSYSGYGVLIETDLAPINQDNLLQPLGTEILWQQINTAQITNIYPVGTNVLPDGGNIIADGLMGYWESTEIYPDDRPDIWNASAHPWSDVGNLDFDLCGHNIRHHKFPDNILASAPAITNTYHIRPGGDFIRVMAVQFENIRPPVDNNGIPITSIVGYEILRGSREGNKTIIAKGIINNMRPTTLDAATGKQGLYQNYPYNCLSTNDPSLTNPPLSTGGTTNNNAGATFDIQNITPIIPASKDVFTFHSPDTQFRNPFLSSREIKLYGEYNSQVEGYFSPVPGHPKEKLLTDFAFIVAAIIGFGIAGQAMRGRKHTNRSSPAINTGSANKISGTLLGGYATGFFAGEDNAISAIAGVSFGGYAAITSNNLQLFNILLVKAAEVAGASIGNLIATAVSPLGDPAELGMGVLQQTLMSAVGLQGYKEDRNVETPVVDYLGTGLKGSGGLTMLSHYWTLGTDSILRLIQAAVHFDNYAYRYLSHGYYNQFGPGGMVPGNKRRIMVESDYLDNQFQDFGLNFRINNLYRGRCVVLQTNVDFQNPAIVDTTYQTIGSKVLDGTFANFSANEVKKAFNSTSSCYYAGLKINLSNQYGQMGSIMELPISCVYDNTPVPVINPYPVLAVSPVLFGGDIYITRHTEKNTFFYFYDWLYNQPDGYEYDYRLRYMVNFPIYWADFTQYEMSEFLDNFVSNISSGSWPTLPSAKFALDRAVLPTFSNLSVSALTQAIAFRIKESYFYLFQSGVRDFYVESEINVALRDWGNDVSERHYDPYGYADLPGLFDPTIIKVGNFFKYDISLSVSRLYNNFISWGNVQPRDYDPIVAEKCFSYYPNRVLYSLPQNLENKKDYLKLNLL